MDVNRRVKKFKKMFAGSLYAKGDIGDASIVDLIADAPQYARVQR